MKFIVKYHTDGSDEIIADKYEIVGPIVKMNSDGVEVAQDLYRRAVFTDDKGVVAEINMQYVRGIFTIRPEEKTERLCYYDPLRDPYVPIYGGGVPQNIYKR